jgi:hypothetical protein
MALLSGKPLATDASNLPIPKPVIQNGPSGSLFVLLLGVELLDGRADGETPNRHREFS